MQQTDNIDKLLEEWDRVAQIPCLSKDSVDEVIDHESLKCTIDLYAREVKRCRLINDDQLEQYYTQCFMEAYDDFHKTFFYRIMKHG